MLNYLFEIDVMLTVTNEKKISTKDQETRCKNSMVNVKLGLFH